MKKTPRRRAPRRTVRRKKPVRATPAKAVAAAPVTTAELRALKQEIERRMGAPRPVAIGKQRIAGAGA